MIDKIRLNAHMANDEIEYVMCAANWVDDGIDYNFKPYNINTGRVFSGHRHPQIFELTREIYPYDIFGISTTQGFLTTKNRFLTRAEALILVKENDQLKGNIIGGELTSEDLW